MSAAKHTPGPWRVGTPGPNGCYTVGTTQGLMTAMVAHSINLPDQREQAIADAHLIASAPELKQALESLLTWADWIEQRRGAPSMGEPNTGARELARAAIAKATGAAS